MLAGHLDYWRRQLDDLSSPALATDRPRPAVQSYQGALTRRPLPQTVSDAVDAAARHHRVHLHDIREPLDGHVTPSGDHVRGLVEFLKGWRNDEPLLVHCWAGISRSTATAFIAACLHNPQTDEREIALGLRAASPTAFPNTRIVAFADELLNRGGRMTAAVEAMGESDFAEEAAPFSIPSVYGARIGAARA